MTKLKVIRASAGSGKTYTLTEEYLKMAFHNTDSFRHILAVTFTNKATAEMKSRLISELFLLSTGQESLHMGKLRTALDIPETEIRSRAAIILQKILHNFSRFFVGTIDSFFQQIIRSFTREMGIQSGYTIELDTDPILEEAINRLQSETTTNNVLLHWLTDYALDKIEKGHTWNFRKDITRLGQQLFNEQFKTFSNTLSDKLADKEFMNTYQQDLHSIRKKFETSMRQMASQGVRLFRSAGLDTDDFFQAKSGPAAYLLKISNGIIPEPNSYVKKAALSAEGWFSKASSKKKAIENLCNNGLLKILQEILSYYEHESRNYFTTGHILKNLYALAILADLSWHLQDYCRENNVFLLSEAASFLNKVIDNNDTPFVYEKTGNHFHHFMIDEFQDTSLLQWHNFKPLISNSLSQHYDNLIVGDVKQSIYRWRNSNWEILANDVGSEFYEQILSFETLYHNHRSSENIIRFNNTFFQEASHFIQACFDKQAVEAGNTIPENLHQAIIRNFGNAVQIPGQPEKPGGLVHITLLKDEPYKMMLEEQLFSLISELLTKGYTAKDIAILTRKNDEAKEITNYLLSWGDRAGKNKQLFGVISDESLYLSNSTAVRFLIGILRYYSTPEDIINQYLIISEYINYLLPDEERHRFNWFPNAAEMQDHDLFAIFPETFKQITESSVDLSLFELVEHLISLFKLDDIKGESVYLQAFQDVILDYSQRESSSIVDFIEFWDEKGCKKPVALPGNQNAIRVLTIHKAKGLEFPVVILPYCNWDLADHTSRPILWCKPNQPPFNKLSIVPVEFTSKLGKTHFAFAYFEELLKQYIDTLNLLYVAFTRASKALFIFSPQSEKDQVINVSDLLLRLVTKEVNPSKDENVISLKKYYHEEDQIFEFGVLPYAGQRRNSPDKMPVLNNCYPVFNTKNRLKVAYQGKILIEQEAGHITRSVSTGSQMHDIFSHIINLNDIPVVVDRWRLERKITASEAEAMTSSIKGYLTDVRVLSWFSGDWKVMTETEFILPDGTVKRPDRVLIKDDKAIIIDYKFGKIVDNEHNEQVRAYHRLLLDMGYNNVEAWLWYVTLNKVVQVERG